MARSRYRFGKEYQPYFKTSTVIAWLQVCSNPELAMIVLESWKFLQRERSIDILAWVILENHIHWIGVGPDLGRRVGEVKSFTATSILRKLESIQMTTLLQELSYYKLRHKADQKHQLWQEGSHPQVIESDEVMWQKIEYIHNNPLCRGYFDATEDWRYSSARAYAGRESLMDVVIDWR